MFSMTTGISMLYVENRPAHRCKHLREGFSQRGATLEAGLSLASPLGHKIQVGYKVSQSSRVSTGKADPKQKRRLVFLTNISAENPQMKKISAIL